MKRRALVPEWKAWPAGDASSDNEKAVMVRLHRYSPTYRKLIAGAEIPPRELYLEDTDVDNVRPATPAGRRQGAI